MLVVVTINPMALKSSFHPELELEHKSSAPFKLYTNIMIFREIKKSSKMFSEISELGLWLALLAVMWYVFPKMSIKDIVKKLFSFSYLYLTPN